ncbi:carboxymuconolactone decarboxylase family protein [Sulfurimonas marina]|uniref:Carboxymuconolactone decarboxylase n=1 Tax=Sulfurimonas marina TaxID=2590551 RepID=A0A7M1AXR1_9BACT|nr:carboxymuconolactone decarboxylase family protein [Sulfurimonas marina]QOP41162.1 carboxymuconolactone decarboxylase [Sulfurimonas marina]
MRLKIFTFLFSLFSATCSFAEQTDQGMDILNVRQQAIISISAFTANGDIVKLKSELNAGLESDLSVNEIKEILIQLYAYCGFPRSLNGINAFIDVIKEREAQGIKDNIGKEATPLPKDMDKDAYGAKVRRELAGWDKEPPAQGYQLFTPVMDVYLKEHLFADIFARDVLNHQERELVTIAALAAMSGTQGQLQFHFGAAINSGFTLSQMYAFVKVLNIKIGQKEAKIADKVLSDVLKSRGNKT